MSDSGTIFFEPISGDSLPAIPILQDAREFMLKWYNEQSNARYVFHNYNRTERILQIAHQLGNAEEISQQDMTNLLVAGCFCEINKVHSNTSPDLVWQNFLQTWEYNSDTRPVVPTLIAHYLDPEKQSKLANILRDAVMAASYSEEFEKNMPLQRLEFELVNNRKFSNLEWNQYLYRELLSVNYRTPSAKRIYGEQISAYLLEKKNRIEKLSQQTVISRGAEAGGLPFEGIEKKLPNSAIQTFFRTNYRNHINLSSIADTKANIMISVNAILISVVISILSYQNIPETKPIVFLPVVIFLVTGLTSLVLAVLSIRPKVTALNDPQTTVTAARKNILFFGNFVNLSVEQYEQAMDAVLRDGQLLYGNMVRDIYYLGKVLEKKYRFLTLSYTIFMYGFVATVLTFLLVLFA